MRKPAPAIEVALFLVAVLLVLAVACHVKPLPVPNAEEWEPGYGITEYPPMPLGAARDAGPDGR